MPTIFVSPMSGLVCRGEQREEIGGLPNWKTSKELHTELLKRAETDKQEKRRKLGRPLLRWKDCLKIDLREAEEKQKWREKGQRQGAKETNNESSHR